MLTAFGRAFKTPDLRRKILFTLSIIAVYRLGAHVPTPGVSYPLVQQCIEGADNTNGLLGLVNLFSGGALLQLSMTARPTRLRPLPASARCAGGKPPPWCAAPACWRREAGSRGPPARRRPLPRPAGSCSRFPTTPR